jgi:hypothetical protein
MSTGFTFNTLHVNYRPGCYVMPRPATPEYEAIDNISVAAQCAFGNNTNIPKRSTLIAHADGAFACGT